MGIQITQSYSQIAIDRTPSRLEIQTERARLELHTEQPKINIHTELPKVEIDQHECFATAGLKNNLEMTDDAAQNGYQQALEYIGKTASDGNALAAIEHGGNPIADISERDAWPTHEFGLDFIPKVGPKITLKEGSVNLDAEGNSEGINNGVSGTFTPAYLNENYNPSELNVYLKKYASININYQQDSKFDFKI